jgi:hypothetical protein
LLIITTSSCAWIGQDYYFENDNNYKGWTKKFQLGKDSDKNGSHRDTVIFNYQREQIEIELDVGYQDTTIFGPLIIPILPLPWDHTGELTVKVSLETKSDVEVDVSDWVITDLDTNSTFIPQSVYRSGKGIIPPTFILEEKNKVILFIRYPIKASEINYFDIKLGVFLYGKYKISPPNIVLKKVKGNWHYNQWTL